jgi:sugar phosphate permease
MSVHDKKSQPDPYTEESVSPATTSDLDASYEAYKSHEGSPIDPEEAKRVLRKIDMRIVPILFVIYLLQYLDKNSLNFAAAYGFQKGTHLHKQQYSWLSSIFYFGYLWAQLPAGYLLQKLPIGKFLGTTTISA